MYRTLIIALLSAAPLLGGDKSVPVDSELTSLDRLIAASQDNIAAMTALKAELQEYQTIQRRILDGDRSKELLLQSGKIAHAALTTIEEKHLQPLFSKELLEELALFSQVATKRPVPR